MRDRTFLVIASSVLASCTSVILIYIFQSLSPSVSLTERVVSEREVVTAVRAFEDVIPVVIEEANDAVVSIIATKDVPIYEQYFEEWNPFGFFGGFQVPRVRERGTEEREIGGGSGFIVSPEGHIVTNRHVVNDTEARYSVVFADGSTAGVTIVATDQVLDIAVLAIENPTTTFPYLTFAADEPRLGETIIVIGNALAEFRNSVSVGVISGLSRNITAQGSRGRSEMLREVMQTDAAINPGNSGGPLLNLKGEVVGVAVATTRGADNISFALPAAMVRDVVESVKENGRIVRPYLGIRYTMITPRMKELNNLTVDYGALITRGDTREELAVMPGSPADRAGLRENDIILSIDGVALRTTDVAMLLRTKAVGSSITLRIWRAGNEEEVVVTLAAMPQQSQ